MTAKMSLQGLILSSYPYLRSAMVRFPLRHKNRLSGPGPGPGLSRYPPGQQGGQGQGGAEGEEDGRDVLL